MDEVAEVIQTVRPGKAVLWDLFTLNPHNGGRGVLSDFGKVLTRLDAHTLTKLRDWLEENRDQAVERYGYNTWLRLRTYAGLRVTLPADMHLPDTKDGLPFQIVAMRKDGKKWDLNIPIRAELLRRVPRYFSESDYAKLAGASSRKVYRRIRDAIGQEGFTLDKFTAEVLYRIVYGKERGPGRKL